MGDLEGTIDDGARYAASVYVNAHIAALEADNAALLAGLRRLTWQCRDQHADEHQRADSLADDPHPGTNLLAVHAKALVRARNEGLAEAQREVRGARAKTAPPSEAYALLTYADDGINALKEPES
jgi:hypothetical protein